ncbi:hypothetical protein MIDIC_330038 [Alphaproteobacteria bacterium]
MKVGPAITTPLFEFKPAEIETKIPNIEFPRPNPADFSSHIKIDDLLHPGYFPRI